MSRLPAMFRSPSWALVALTTSLAFVAGTALATVAWFATGDSGSTQSSIGSYSGSTYYTASSTLDDSGDDATAATATAETTSVALPALSDFAMEVKILSKQCFDTAGCVVEFSVVPSYTGAGPLSPDVIATVTYEMVGTKDPQTGSFTMTGGRVNPPDGSFGETGGASVALTARVTEVF